MTRKLSTVVMVAVVLLSTVGGVVALGGSAVAFESNGGSTYPATTNTSTIGTGLYAVRPDDAVAEDGIETITLDVGPEASVANVTAEDVYVAIRGTTRYEIDNVTVSSSADGSQLEITLPRTVQPPLGEGPSTGSEVAVKFRNFTTPSEPGTYSIEGSVSTPSGETDGPASVSYTVTRPELSFANQSLSQFDEQQQLDLTAAIRGGGYVGLFTVAENGSRGQLVGSTNVSTGREAENYTVDVSGNVTETQELVAVAYTESVGRSVGIRREQTFDPATDDPLVVGGDLVNATATIATIDVDGRLTAGGEYDQGERLYFDQGEASTGYQITRIESGELGAAADQFQTAANGTAIVDTGGLDEGQYAITRVDDGSLVGLDDDSTTGPGDDSFVVTGQQVNATTTGTTNATTTGATNATTTAGGTDTTVDETTTDDGEGNVTETTPETSMEETTASGEDTTEGGADTETSGGETNGSGGEATEEGGPGFTVIAAVVALLAVALVAATRR
ncbi:PGF-CTERM sorting domain-containing protein [Halococcus agarilyticus]|uniref:PGF-CTERM sorting domain-containing protein n=1 Tax=Halococcus agarilyticus TaxID=1232219 RepID=UPI000ADAA26A|nr:PGF-CTERM sorting domain-containing protein [Halococcus agarilyticus]